jgi:hypothetical protein
VPENGVGKVQPGLQFAVDRGYQRLKIGEKGFRRALFPAGQQHGADLYGLWQSGAPGAKRGDAAPGMREAEEPQPWLSSAGDRVDPRRILIQRGALARRASHTCSWVSLLDAVYLAGVSKKVTNGWES